MYLFVRNQEAINIVIAKHGGIPVDNTDMIIYPNGDVPKYGEINEETKRLIIQDFEYLKEYIKTIVENILGRSL